MLMITSPALIANQGSVICYQTSLRAQDLVSFLGHDPRSKNWKKLDDATRNLYEEVQRKTDISRIRNLNAYVSDRIVNSQRMPGALPAISIGTTKRPSFSPLHDNTFGSVTFEIGSLRLLFDGLARVSVLLNLLDEDSKNLPDIPVSVYAPASGEWSYMQMAQLFYDFNVLRAKVTAKQAAGRDSSSPYIQIARSLRSLPVFAECLDKNGMTEDKMHRFVRAATENVPVGGTITKKVHAAQVKPENVAAYTEALTVFWERFAQNMGSCFSDVRSGPNKTVNYIHFSTHGYAAIAAVIFRFTSGLIHKSIHKEMERLADALSSIDWSRSNEDWIGVAITGSEDPETGKIIGDRIMPGSGTPRTIEYVIEKVAEYINKN